MIALGVLLMKYSVTVTNYTGKIDLAEKYLPAPWAGTYTWWKLFGFLMCCLAVGWMAGAIHFTGGF